MHDGIDLTFRDTRPDAFGDSAVPSAPLWVSGNARFDHTRGVDAYARGGRRQADHWTLSPLLVEIIRSELSSRDVKSTAGEFEWANRAT